MRALRINLFMAILALSMIAAQSVTAQVAYSYAELKPLLDAESHNEKEKVITLADEIVRRSNDSLGNQARAFAIKGIAYQMRAKAFVELGRGEPNNIIRDLMRAADFGNLNASKALAAVLLNLRAKGSKVLDSAREDSVAFERSEERRVGKECRCSCI